MLGGAPRIPKPECIRVKTIDTHGKINHKMQQLQAKASRTAFSNRKTCPEGICRGRDSMKSELMNLLRVVIPEKRNEKNGKSTEAATEMSKEILHELLRTALKHRDWEMVSAVLDHKQVFVKTRHWIVITDGTGKTETFPAKMIRLHAPLRNLMESKIAEREEALNDPRARGELIREAKGLGYRDCDISLALRMITDPKYKGHEAYESKHLVFALRSLTPKDRAFAKQLWGSGQLQ